MGKCMPTLVAKKFFSECFVVPKRVKLSNWKLGMLLCILRCLAFMHVAVTAWDLQVWNKVFTPGGSYNLHKERRDGKNISSTIATERLQAPYCDTSKASLYDYDWGEGWKYTNMSCTQLPNHLAMIKTASGMFIPTYMEEKLITIRDTRDVNSDGMCATECAAIGDPNVSSYVASGRLNSYGHCICYDEVVQNSFMLGVEQRKIDFEYVVYLDYPRGGMDTIRQSDAQQNLLTIFRDADTHAEIRRVLPGEPLKLVLGELLTMGGSSLEDTLETRVNSLGEGFTKFPVLRITGLDMEFDISCHNYENEHHVEGLSHRGPVCYVELRIIPKWTSMLKAVEDHGDLLDMPRLRSRYLYGINIKIKQGGAFSYLSFQGFYHMIATWIVYMQMPTTIVVLFAQYLLGPLSRIYRKAQIQNFTCESVIHGSCSRILVAKETYISLLEKQIKAHPSETECVTDKTFRHQLFAAIEEDQRGHHKLSESEISSLVHVVMTYMDADKSATVPFPEYLKSHSNDEICNLYDIACLFDFDRKRGALERLFQPPFFQSAHAFLRHQETLHESEKAIRKSENKLIQSNSVNSIHLGAKSSQVDELWEEVARLKCSQDDAIEKANATFDRIVAQIDQVVATRLENEISQFCSRLEHMANRLGSVMTEFQRQSSSEFPSERLGVTGIAISSEQAPPISNRCMLVDGDLTGGIQNEISALQVAHQRQNHVLEMLEAQFADLRQRVERRLVLVEHEQRLLAAELSTRGGPLEGAGVVEHPRHTPMVDIDQRSALSTLGCARNEVLQSDMIAMKDGVEQRMHILSQKGSLPERIEGTVANKSDEHPSQVPELAERLTKLEHGLGKLENEVWQVRDDVGTLDWSWNHL